MKKVKVKLRVLGGEEGVKEYMHVRDADIRGGIVWIGI